MPRKPFSPRTLTAIALVCLLGAGAAWFATRPAQPAGPAATTTPTPRPALAVNTTQPVQARVPLRLEANGNVAAWQEAIVGAESNGLRLAEVRVNVGDVVKKGQVLAVFAPDTVRAEVAQARASLMEARAAAAEAAANAERAATLTASGALSRQQIQQYATAGETAQARVAAAQAALQAQEVRLRHTQVLAPDAGVISSRTATVGAVVNGGAELFRLVRRGRLEWRAEVTSADLPRIRPGQQAVVTAASGAQVQGTVRMVAPTVDPQTRNGLVYVDLPASKDVIEPPPGRPKAARAPSGGSEPRAAGSVGAIEPPPGRPKAAKAPSGGSEPRAAGSVGALSPGMFARGEFLLGARDALTVPQSAVVVRDGFSYVFELTPQGRVAMRRVQTGQRVGDRVEIASGLSAGATLVERGGAFLNDGDVVRVEAAPSTQKQPAAGAAPAQPATK